MIFVSFLGAGVRQGAVSRRVVWADVPLYRSVIQKVFPCSATLAETALILEPPGSQKNRNESTFAKAALLQNRLFVSSQE